MPRSQSWVGVLWSAVATIDCDAPRLAAGELEPFVSLRAGHFMHQVAVDVNQRGAIGVLTDEMAFPQLVIERLCCHGDYVSLWKRENYLTLCAMRERR